MLVSIIITVKNEAESMPHLIESLLVQEKPFEIIVVDSNSTDGTPEIVKKYSSKHPEVKLISYDGTRGDSRNFGVKKSKGEIIAFTDGKCIADPNWLREIRRGISKGNDIVAGKTNRIGMGGFSRLGRVPVYHNGGDASFPTCNIAYKRSLFGKIKGFDPWFKEAEDVDLNYRALDNGGNIVYNKKMIIQHTGAETPNSFIKKSFWYGFGRKELNIRHHGLWPNYNILDMFKLHKGESLWKFVRLLIAFLGYFVCIFVGHKPKAKEKMRQAKFHSH
jgi:glycosyltransferase involved in cell wall biosynthesis